MMINSHEQQQREYCCEFMDVEMQGEENQEEEEEEEEGNLGFYWRRGIHVLHEWWCNRMPERTPPRIRSEQSESAVEPQFVKAMPLREVVADCEKRWFEQTLKAAKNGDVAMQSLVGQMFCSGYGVTANLKKVTTMAGLSFFSRMYMA